MAGQVYKCPYCGVAFAETDENTRIRTISYDYTQEELDDGYSMVTQGIKATYHRCPVCYEYSIKIESHSDLFSVSYPPYTGIFVPTYIPEAIRTDYSEACAILDASPRAAATLARRCLQGMIRDFWNVKEGNLAREIDFIKDKIPADQYKVLNGVRRLGNIGAHMEKDVNMIVDIDPGEAQKLVKLLELLFRDWYIARHDREELYNDILTIDQDKQEQRHPG